MGSSSKTTSEAKPPEWSAEGYKQAGGAIQDWYNSGAGANPFPGSTVAPLSDTTMTGINQMANAGQNWNTAGSRELYQGLGADAANDPYAKLQWGAAAGINNQDWNVNPLGIKPGNVQTGSVGTGNYAPAQSATQGIGGMANSLLNPISSGQTGIGTEGDYRSVLNRAGGPSAAEQYLTPYATGEYLSNGNPYFSAALNNQLADVEKRVRSSMAGMGRTGSGAETTALTSELGKLSTSALADQWAREQANQLTATGMIDASRSGATGDMLSAISGMSGVQGQNIANRMGAAGQQIDAQTGMAGLLGQLGDSMSGVQAADLDRILGADTGNVDRQFAGQTARAGIEAGNLDRLLQGYTAQGNILANAGQQATANRGQMFDATNAAAGLDQQNFENSLRGAQATIDAGKAIDTQSQAQLYDDVSKYYESDNAGATRLGQYLGLLSGVSGPYGSQLSTSRTSNPMAALGAVGSMAGGLKSDMRLKQDIVRIGHADNGLPIYLFRYRDDPDTWHIGYMAQDVLKVNPGAVMVGEDGYFRVDYASASIQKEAA